MTAVKLDEPLSILVLLGLTLPEVSEGDLAKIRAAAPGSTVKVAPRVGDAIALVLRDYLAAQSEAEPAELPVAAD